MDRAAEAEFSEFMHGRWLQLVRLGYVLTGDRGLAEDLAQTALARAYSSWPQIRRAGDPDAYVRRVMVNANRSRFRKRRVAEQLTGAVPEPAPVDATGGCDDRVTLRAALMSLPVPITEARRWGFAEYRGLRTERHTYVRSIHGPWLLYDNRADPYQLHNLIDDPSRAGLIRKLDAMVMEWLKNAKDPFPFDTIRKQRSALSA